jgi:hypothetical protein
MQAPGVLVVAETPSLGRSIVDLLESGNIPSRLVYDVSVEHPLSNLAARFPVVISACNEHFCATARRWARGEFPNVDMVVVGDRDSELPSFAGVRVVSLPLVPAPFLALVHGLLTAAEISGRPAAEPA